MSERWLVLGGTGLVGQYLVQMLTAKGAAVDVVTRREHPLSPGVRAVVADISASRWIDHADLGNYDFVCHLAYATTGETNYDRAVTVESVRALSLRASQMGVKHFIYLGSMAVFGENTPAGTLDESAPKLGQTEYALNKTDATHMILAAPGDFLVSVLHPTGVYDRNSKRITFYKNMLQKGYISAPLTGLNNIVHAEDVAVAIIQCAGRQQGGWRAEYIINGEAVRVSDWMSALEKRYALEMKPKLPRFFSIFCRGPLGALVRKLGWRRALPIPEYKAALYRLQTAFSSEKAQQDFGYKPAHLFAEEMKAAK